MKKSLLSLISIIIILAIFIFSIGCKQTQSILPTTTTTTTSTTSSTSAADITTTTSSTTTSTADTTAPAAPSGFSASEGDGSIALSWSANSESDLAGYNVYRSNSSSGTYSKVNSSLITITSYSDSGLTNGATYYYKITAVDISSNEGSYSSAISATPESSTPLATPGNVSNFQATAGSGYISLSWSNPSDSSFSGVIILRKTTGYPSSASDGTAVYDGSGTSIIDTGLTNGVTYYYTAFAHNIVPSYASGVTASATPYAIQSGIIIGNNFAFYDYIDGYSYLVSKDGLYLGLISSNKYAANSIMNSYGTYGSEYSAYSIFNEYGNYGSPYAIYSAYNAYTYSPPIIYLVTASGDIPIAYLTKNQYLPYAIDPALLAAYYDTK